DSRGIRGFSPSHIRESVGEGRPQARAVLEAARVDRRRVARELDDGVHPQAAARSQWGALAKAPSQPPEESLNVLDGRAGPFHAIQKRGHDGLDVPIEGTLEERLLGAERVVQA